MDTHTPEQRHRNMSAIRSKNTKPEVYLRKLLFARGYRYGLYSKKVTGKPDLWMPKYRTAIFVNGCFWHRHEGCRYASRPKSNPDYWNAKFERNVKRDQTVREELRRKGIRVLTVWECTIKNMKKDPEYRERILNQIEEFLHSDRPEESI